MRIIIKILAFCLLAQAAHAQCDTTGILLELQATTNLQGILLANDRCLTTVTVLAPLTLSNDTLSIDTTGLGGGGSTIGLDTLIAIPPAAGFSIAGSPAQDSRDTLTFSLANDLAALEALADTGIVVRTGTETYALRKAVAGTGISITNGSGVSGNPTITNTGDLSTTNEIQTYGHASAANLYTNTLDLGGGTWSIAGAGIAVVTSTAGAITVTATEAQVANNGLSDNENSGNFRLGNRYMDGSDGLFSNDRKINLNAFRLFIGDNTDSTLLHVDGTNDRVGIHTTAPGRTFTVNGEAEIKDLVTTNPTLLVGADGNGVLSEVTLGSGLSFSGTTLNVSAGSNYQTWRDDGVAATQRPNANFVSTATVTMTLTDDAGNTETEVTANVPTGGITTTQILDGTIATADIANSAVTYAKIQNVSATSRFLGRITAGAGVVEELTAANARTILEMTPTINRFALWTSATALSSDAAFTFDAANDRMTVNGTIAGLGANNAFLNLNSGAISGATEFLRMSGNITGNMIAGMYNANNVLNSNTIFTLSVGGSVASDPVIQYTVSGVGTAAMGVDNSDADKFKITPNSATVGGVANASLVITRDAIPLYGINKDAPGHPLDVSGRARSNEYLGVGTDKPTVGTLGAGLGTGPTINDVTGTNNGFSITFTTGTTPTAGGDMFTVTYATAYPGFAIPVFCANDDDAAADISKFTFNGVSGASFTMKVRGGQTLSASTQYALHFAVNGF